MPSGSLAVGPNEPVVVVSVGAKVCGAAEGLGGADGVGRGCSVAGLLIVLVGVGVGDDCGVSTGVVTGARAGFFVCLARGGFVCRGVGLGAGVGIAVGAGVAAGRRSCS